MCEFRSQPSKALGKRSSRVAPLLEFVIVQEDIAQGDACTERQVSDVTAKTPSRCRVFRSHSTTLIVRQSQALAFTLARSTFIVHLNSLPCCHQLIFSPLPLLVTALVRSTPLPVQGQYQQQVYISTTSNKQQQPIIPNHNHNQISVSSARPGPRPSMMSDLPNKWLWCDDNAKVNRRFQHEVNRHRYRVFYSFFINACDRVWVISVDKNSTHKLQPLAHLIYFPFQNMYDPHGPSRPHDLVRRLNVFFRARLCLFTSCSGNSRRSLGILLYMAEIAYFSMPFLSQDITLHFYHNTLKLSISKIKSSITKLYHFRPN
ncbi:hypothetical protein E4T42_07817 [Aureobasidium subglaciale]|nr:hypothetical protein E4T42_07817 [Aureobasidium subglaciale]